MRRILLTLLVLCGVAAFAAEPLHFSFVIHGRSPLEPQSADRADYGLVEAVFFAGEPVVVTLTAVNAPQGDGWAKRIEWELTDSHGKVLAPRVTDLAPASRPHVLAARAAQFNVTFAELPPGRYTVRASSVEPGTDRRVAAEARTLTIYRGDENVVVRRAFLRERAKAALAQGTAEGYRSARGMLLEAAEGNTDPSYYELLADASAPWAAPEETAEYYERSLAVARANLERKFGKTQEWPDKAVALFTKRAQKVSAFRELVPYYRTNFSQVRVVVLREGPGDQFVVERRSDGARLRVVTPRQQ